MTKDWLEMENSLGCSESNRMVLATAGKNAVPHSRIVAIREITDKGLLFFTQRGTRKTEEIQENPIASATIWLPLQQREIIFDGKIESLSQTANERYWQDIPRDRQLKFWAYAQTSGQKINSINELENKFEAYAQQFKDSVPITDFYCGYELIPERIIFYTLGQTTFSEVFEFTLKDNAWHQQRISP